MLHGGRQVIAGPLGGMRDYAFYATIGSVITAGLHFLGTLPWGWAALAAFVGWPLIGTLITIDDELPGGFFYDPDVKPTWLQASFWAQILLGLGIAATVAVIDVGLGSSTGRVLGVSALLAFLFSRVLLVRSRGNRTQP